MLDAFYPGRIDLGVGRGQRRDTGFKPKPPSAKDRPPRQWREVDGVVIPLPFDLRGLLDTERVLATMGILQQPEAVAPDFADQLGDILAMLDGTYEVDGFDVHAVPGERSGLSAVDLWQHPGPECATGRRTRAAVRRELSHHPGDRAGSHRGLPRHVRPVGNAAAALRRGVRRRRRRRRQRHRTATRRRLRALGVLHPDRGGRGALPASRRLRSAHRGSSCRWSRTGWRRNSSATRMRSPSGCRRLQRLTGADELVVTSVTHDHQDRLRSHELLAKRWGIGE